MDSDEDAGDGEAGPFVTMGPLLGTFAPAGILVKTAMENRMRGSADATSVTAIPGGDNSMDRSIEAGVGSRDYFQPGRVSHLYMRHGSWELMPFQAQQQI